MVAIGHTGVGVIVGITAFEFLGNNNLASGLIITGAAGIISHYLMDFIPHGHFFGPGKFKKYILPVIIFDVFLPIALILGGIYLKNGFSEKLLYIMFGIGGSQLPDIVDGLIYSGKIKTNSLLRIENSFHEAMHWHGRDTHTLLIGLRDVWQLVVILAAVFLVFLA